MVLPVTQIMQTNLRPVRRQRKINWKNVEGNGIISPFA
jgi:hypothetical protein